jgi:hypothetical protein
MGKRMKPATVQLTRCPECDGTAEVEYRSVLDSTDGPVEHVKIRCVNRHWFNMPVSYLDCMPLAATPRATASNRF